jgi:hypothetical protein
MRAIDKISYDELRKLLSYNPETGEFTWLVNRGRGGFAVSAGSVAGSLCESGYVRIKVAGVFVYAHCLAWLYMTGSRPPTEVDHVDTVRSNNRWTNLRLATDAQNSQNQRNPRSDNKSGFLGVSLHRQSGKYRATIGLDGKRHSLGLYVTPQEAHQAYVSAKRKLHAFGTL